MSYRLAEVLAWDTAGLSTTSTSITERADTVHDAGRILSDGREALDQGWDGVAADAVLDAADQEGRHASRLAAALDDLADVLSKAEQALHSAVQVVRDRVTEADEAGVGRFGDVLAPTWEDGAVSPSTVDLHVAAVRDALDTVAALDEHYGREIDEVAARIHDAIPAEPDRSRIPAADTPWPAVAIDAITGALDAGTGLWGDELDPRTRGAHAALPFSEDFARRAGPLLKGASGGAFVVGLLATAYGGYKDYREGKTSKGEAVVETTAAAAGGIGGGFLAGAAGGSVLGPPGALVLGALGAAAGSPAGKALGDAAHESVTEHHELLLEQYRYGI